MSLDVDRLVAGVEGLDGVARVRAEGLLRELGVVVEGNPLERVGFSRGGRSYVKQLEFLAAREPLQGFFGGNGSGKSHAGALKAVLQLVDWEVVPERLRGFKFWDPPVAGRVVVPKTSQIEGVALEKLRQLVPKSQLVGGSFDKSLKGRGTANAKLFLGNGSTLEFKTSDQDRDAHAGVELRFVWFDEEPEGEHGRGIYTENVARLRRFLPDAMVWFTMTPLFGLSWSFDEIFERRDEPGVFVRTASMFDNPFIDASAVVAQLGHLSAAERQAVVEGKFTALHGTVVSLGEEHIVDPLTPERLRGMDVLEGYDPGFARGGVVWCAFDERNRMFVFDELYPSRLTVPQIVEQMMEKRKLWRIDPMYTVFDPAARASEISSGASVVEELAKHGIYTSKGRNDRLAGVFQLRSRLENDGLFVARNCLNVIQEARRWVVAEDEESGKGDRFKTKGPDHLWDPIRYVCMERLFNDYDTTDRTQSPKLWRPGVAPPAEWFTPTIEEPPLGAMS